MNQAPTVEEYIANAGQWQGVMTELRLIFNSTELEEGVKWGAPIYMIDGKNVCGMASFKNHCAIWFHQGALMADKSKVLVNAQEGVTQAQRQWRFEDGDTVDAKLVLAYLNEAIENCKEGKEIKPQKKPLIIPQELESAMTDNPNLREMFEKMTLTKKREHADSIGGAKQEKTRITRLEKSIPMILEGRGLHDKYR